MIISQTPYRVSFAGGGTDLPAFYRRRVRRRPEHDDRPAHLRDDPPAVRADDPRQLLADRDGRRRSTRSSTTSSARRCGWSRSTSRWRSPPSATSRRGPGWAPAAA